MKLKGIFTALLAAALVCLLPVTAQADAETQPALLLSASQTLVERYNTFTVDVFLTGTPGADILPAAETHIDCDNASVEATSAGTAANSKITADGTAVTLSYYGEESAVFDESGRFLLGTITLKAGRSGIATVTASRSVGAVDGLTDVDIPAANLADKRPCGRVNLREIDCSERKGSFRHIEEGMTEEEACQEASRCLRCDHFGLGKLKGGRESW